MKKITTANYLDKMSFDINLNNHNFIIDADEKVGGEDKGPRPKGLLLSGLAGCTGMDVVSILKKMKITEYDLKIDVLANMTEEHPKYYDKIEIHYIFEGKDLPGKKIKKAVNLSEERYCGVSAMLGKAAEINSKIFINKEKI